MDLLRMLKWGCTRRGGQTVKWSNGKFLLGILPFDHLTTDKKSAGGSKKF